MVSVNLDMANIKPEPLVHIEWYLYGYKLNGSSKSNK